MPEPTAKSTAERRLERIHDEDARVTAPGELQVRAAEVTVELAQLISSHPGFEMSAGEVLDVTDDYAELSACCEVLYAEFGGMTDA